MEKIPNYILLILALTGYVTVDAQEAKEQAVKSNTKIEASHSSVTLPAVDPKLSPEQGGPGHSMPGNVVRPPVLVDEKMINENPSGVQQSGSTNPRPEDGLKDPKLAEDGTLLPSSEVKPVNPAGSKDKGSSQDNKQQPAGIAPGNILNYRNIKGPHTQPAPAQKVDVINYRTIKGPKTQPKGEQPKQEQTKQEQPGR